MTSGVATGGTSYQLTEDGVHLRAQPSTAADILIQNLDRCTPVTAVSDQLVDADGHRWRNVRTPGRTFEGRNRYLRSSTGRVLDAYSCG
jgi:hypothetical protein